MMREWSLPLEPITCAATVREINCSLKASRVCRRRAWAASSARRTCSNLMCSICSLSWSRCARPKMHLLQPHVFELLLELAVLGAYSAQIKVVVPEIAAAVLDPDQTALEGGDRAHRPNADQASFFLIAAAFFDLHRQPKYL